MNDQNSVTCADGESQLSQASLFSGSDFPSSLELFSQPFGENLTDITAVKPTPFDTSKLTQNVGKKYYMKYLSSHSLSDPSANGLSTLSRMDGDNISTNAQCEVWRNRELNQLERKKFMAEIVASVKGTVAEQSSIINHLRDFVTIAVDKSAESSQWENQALGLCQQLLQEQEESKHMIMAMQKELSQQRHVLKSFSNQLSSVPPRYTASCSSVETERILDVLNTLQHKTVATFNVGTLTSPILLENSDSRHEIADQAVPESNHVSLIAEGGVQLSHIETCPDDSSELTIQGQFNESACVNDRKPLQKQVSKRSSLPLSQINEEFIADITYPGRRSNEHANAAAFGALCKSHKKPKLVKKSTDTNTPRRRSSRLRKPVKYTQVGHATSSKSCENNSVLSVKSAVKRKVETAKGIQWNSFRRSPVNALSDALYSDHYSSCSSEIPGRTGLHNTPLTSAQFHRKNEAARRKKMMISNLSDPELLLRELQDCIINQVNSCDPSS